jgi:hypothetical protein
VFPTSRPTAAPARHAALPRTTVRRSLTAALGAVVLCALTAHALHAQHPMPTILACVYAAPPGTGGRNAAAVYHGLAISADLGMTWETRGWMTDASNDIAAHQTRDSLLFLATDYGVLRSTDAGQTWTLVTGWRAGAALAVLCAGDSVWAATPGGPWLSTDAGLTWALRDGGLTTLNMRYCAGIAVSGGAVFVATADGVFRSADGGGHWTRAGVEGYSLEGLAGSDGGPLLATFSENGGLWISTDAGTGWQQRNDGLRSTRVRSAAFDRGTPGTLYAGTADMGAFKSTDAGATWVLVGGGITNFTITALAVDPGDSRTVLAGTSGGIFLSRDGGRMWKQTRLQVGLVSDILIR